MSPMPCSICVRPAARKGIDADLLKGDSLRSVAARHQLSLSTLHRHTKHVAQALVKSPEGARMLDENDNVRQLQGLLNEAGLILQKAQRKRNGGKLALAAIRELANIHQLLLRVAGSLRPAQHNELHVHVDPSRAAAMAQAYLASRQPVLEGEPTRPESSEPADISRIVQTNGDNEKSYL